LLQPADAHSPQLVLAPGGRCAPAGRPPAWRADSTLPTASGQPGAKLALDLGDFLGPLASAALRWKVIQGRSAPAESKQVQEW